MTNVVQYSQWQSKVGLLLLVVLYSVYHIHTLQTGDCGPRLIKLSDKIFQACYM